MNLGAAAALRNPPGAAAEQSISTSAVNATAGLAATYNGVLINALFYATSGGKAADSEDVFSVSEPYVWRGRRRWPR